MYAAAFVLAVLVNRGALTWWRDWSDPVPAPVALDGPRARIEEAMWASFGFDTAVVLRSGSAPVQALGGPARVLVDPFFDPQRPERVTVVKQTLPGTTKSQNSVKVRLDDPAWLWNDSGASLPLSQAVEYNPVNSYNQQNGVRCALPASSAVASGHAHAAATYHLNRLSCPSYQVNDNTCGINGAKCASDGAGGTRIPKPRVIIPPSAFSDEWLLTPTAFDELVSQARTDKSTGSLQPLPKARDIAILTGWAQRGTGDALDFGPLVTLLGPSLVHTLTEP